jgi:hypothetical protein
MAFMPQSANASHLRTKNSKNNKTTKDNATINTSTRSLQLDTSFDCTIYEMHGMTPPGVPDMEPTYECVREASGTNSEKVYTIDTDVEEKYGDQYRSHTLSKMTIPFEAVDGSVIKDHPKISINTDHSRRDKRHLVSTMGNHKLLIVVIEDDYDHTVNRGDDELHEDYFEDLNSVVSLSMRSM